MEALVLIAGVLLVVYGVAALAGGRTAGAPAGHSRKRAPSTAYGAAILAGGVVCVVAGLVWLVV